MSDHDRALVVQLRGDDPSLLRDAVRRAVDGALGEEDRSLAVEEFAGEDYEMASVVDAAQTPPLFTPFRIVVARDLERFDAAAMAPLVRYLAEPAPSTTLILAWGPGGGRLPKAVKDALAAAGAETVDAGLPSGRARRSWLDEELARAEVRFDRDARQLLADRLGDDLGRVAGIVATLEASFGPGAQIDADELAPFLGEAGSVPPWELTDAIDAGDAAAALDRLHRLMSGGERHPLQIMVTLQNHVERLVRLHGSGAADERAAASVLGLRGSTFPARKALSTLHRLDGARLTRAVDLLAEADVQLRGSIGWPPEQVLEVLVARLARLSR